MATPSRMPRYDIRNDGMGPYAIFYCDKCYREYRSQPDLTNTITRDIGKQAMGGFLRKIPLVGGELANNALGQDQRYTTTLTPGQLESAWKQVQGYFRECPTCHQILCLSDFDEQSGYCQEDSPRRNEMEEAKAEQAGRALKGFANALGIGDVIKKGMDAAQQAQTQMARCPQDGTLAKAGTKFCPNCGTPMVQPAAAQPAGQVCPNCGAQVHGAKFCPECGTKIEQMPPANCPSCGAETKGGKFCPECGTKLVA